MTPTSILVNMIGLEAEQVAVYSVVILLMRAGERPHLDSVAGVCSLRRRRVHTIASKLAEKGFVTVEGDFISIPELALAIAIEKARPKPSVWARLRTQVFERDSYTCRYCGIADSICIESMHCDHVVPASQGGPATLENLATACPDCSARKGARTPEQAGMRLLPVSA